MPDLVSIPGETVCREAMVQFMGQIMPGVPTFVTQVNRVPEASGNFAMMTVTNRKRLSTNVDTYDDCQFEASIAGTAMTVASVAFGKVTPGRKIFGVGLDPESVVVSGPADGGPGVYVVSPAQTATLRTMAAGVENIKQPIELAMQMDFYGPNASDNSTTFSTIFRDEYGVSIFKALPGGISPLYTSEPQNAVFVAEEQQYEDRWMLTAFMQVDSVVSVPKQFADEIAVARKPVDAFYPA
jgi:hypothetical protein